MGAYGVSLHDNDLVPIDATLSERNKILREFGKVVDGCGMTVTMVSANLFYEPVFKEGAFTSNDPKIRAYAVQKSMRAMDLGAELGAKLYIFWGGREGTETDSAKSPIEALKWLREAINFLVEYSLDQKYGYKFALEAKPNEPRGDIFLPTTGAMLAFISTLDHPLLCGVNPEVAHEHMAGLNVHHAVAQALEAGKLFHIDLNAQKLNRYDQDLRFGSEDIKGAFFLVKLLEDSHYRGPSQFDAHAYRTEDEKGVWDFALGCMRTYNILRLKAKQFSEDREIQEIVHSPAVKDEEIGSLLKKYSRKNAKLLDEKKLNRNKLAARGWQYERLDQLTMELLLGLR
jgi:xylose isomerase